MYANLQEEEVKNRITETYFPEFDYKKIIRVPIHLNQVSNYV